MLIHSINEITHDFLYAELERNKAKLKSRLVWIGARREVSSNNSTVPSFHKSRVQSNLWKWVNGKLVNKYVVLYLFGRKLLFNCNYVFFLLRFLWASDQPNVSI